MSNYLVFKKSGEFIGFTTVEPVHPQTIVYQNVEVCCETYKQAIKDYEKGMTLSLNETCDGYTSSYS